MCIQCGYNLRTLRVDAACPECGGLVSDSLRGDELRFASCAWLRKVLWGLWLIEWAVGGFLAVLLGIVALAMSVFVASVGVVQFMAWTVQGVVMLALLCGAAGLLLVTVPNPGRPPRGTSFDARLRVRAATIASAVLLALSELTRLVGSVPAAVSSVARTLALLSLVLPAVCLLGMLVELLTPVPNALRTVSSARRMRKGLTTFLIVYPAARMLEIAVRGSGGTIVVAVGVLEQIAWLVLFVSTLGSCSVISRARKVVSSEYAAARKTDEIAGS